MKNQVSYDFKGFAVLITEAASGMGETTARMFAESGAQVMLADRNEAQLKQLADELSGKGYQVAYSVCDVSDEEQVEATVNKAVNVFGKLDAAYNNAGIMCALKNTPDVSEAEFDRTINVNLKGVWLCMKHELKQMEKQGSGAIVNASSIGGMTGSPGRSPYSASKHGIIGLTQSAALEYASKGIRVNAVCPGTIATPMVDEMLRTKSLVLEDTFRITPANYLGTAEDIASAVLWLCSSASSYVTGQALAVDGGYLAL